MKNIIFFLLLIVITNKANLFAQCTINASCAEQKFPYWVCFSNGERGFCCAADPYNIYENTTTKATPLKFNGSFCYKSFTYKDSHKQIKVQEPVWSELYDTPYYGDNGVYYGIYDGTPIYDENHVEMTGYSDGDEIEDPYYTILYYNTTYHDDDGPPCNHTFIEPSSGAILFNLDDVQNCIDKARSAWENICSSCGENSSVPSQNCCIPIIWSNNSDDFINGQADPKTDYAMTFRKCNCDASSIVLNQCDVFTGATPTDPCGYYTRFFITSNTAAFNTKYWSLTAVLMHEMGHIFGFDDEYKGKGAACPHTNSIMLNTPANAISGETGFNDPNKGLSDDDICMYKKLYCNVTTGVEDNSEDKDEHVIIKTYPNPTNSNAINLDISNPKQETFIYEIISSIGQVIINGTINPNESKKTINLLNLSSGIYMIVLKGNGSSEIQKFIVNN